MKETFYWFNFVMSFHTCYISISLLYYYILGVRNDAHGLNLRPTIMMNFRKSAEFKPAPNHGTSRYCSRRRLEL